MYNNIMFCIFSGYTSVEILHDESQILSASCGHIFHTIANVTLTDQGWYTCRARDAHNNVIEQPFGNIRIVGECCHKTENNIIHHYSIYHLSDSSVVQAEPMQYGLLNFPASLNCLTTLDVFDFLIDFTWFRREGSGRTQLNSPQFERTALSDDGVYTCRVNINEFGAVIERTIDFQVIGKHTITLYLL